MIFSKVNSDIELFLKNYFFQEREEFPPLLFLSSQKELLHQKICDASISYLKHIGADEQSFFHISDSENSIKIEQVREMLQKSHLQARFGKQIFFIESIERMTLDAANSCLKFFEEPGKGNIIFLSNSSESGILETILSRVQIHPFFQSPSLAKNQFFETLIRDHISGKESCVKYFFSYKGEKEEYIDFLKTLFEISFEEQWFSPSWYESLESNIQGILKNNLSARYIVDQYILSLGCHFFKK